MKYSDQNNEQLANPSPVASMRDSGASCREMESLEKSHHGFVRKTTPRYGGIYVGPEYDFIHWLEQAEKLMHKIATDDATPFELIRPSRGKPFYRMSKVATNFFILCKSFDPSIAEYYRHHRFNPYLTIMLRIAAASSQELTIYTNSRGDPMPGEPRFREILKRDFDSIRSTYTSADFTAEVDNYKRNEEKNVNSCCEYIAAQFDRRSQLLVLRVDLYYRPPFKEWGYTPDADAHYARFLRALRENRIVPDVLGYISKREDGIDRGIHYHTLVILDGHKHRDAANLTRLIGEEWVRRCGTADYDEDARMGLVGEQNRGSYFNCYTRAGDYKFNGLGLVHPTNADKLRGLRLAIEYMCKETSQLKAGPLNEPESDVDSAASQVKGSRNLRRGVMPKGHSGRGAPRSSGSDRSAIDRDLLKK